MQQAFREVKLSWDGRDFVIPPDKMLGAIARIEDVFTLEELSVYMARRTAPLGKLARSYGAVLRYAGARVTDEEIYFGMFGKGGINAAAAMEAIAVLLAMMLPPGAVDELEQGGEPPDPTSAAA